MKEAFYECEGAEVALTSEGDIAVMEFKLGGTTETVKLGLPLDAARTLHYHLGLLVSASTGPSFVPMTEINAVDASSTDHPGNVLVTLKSKSGGLHHFLLPAGLSTALRDRMKSAEDGAEQGLRLPRA